MVDFVFLDSGIGGIPYMTSLLEREKNASCLYVADTANFPYGEKTHEQVVDSVSALVEKICKTFEPAVIVLACNTISVNALESLRQKFPKINFVGTVPAIKLAASISKKRKLGLLATKATCENPYNLELQKKFASDCQIVKRPDPDLIYFIEHKAFTASRQECIQALTPAVDFFKSRDCDVMILGCTHFLNIKDLFQQACGSTVQVVDSVDGVVRHALEVWEKNWLGQKTSSTSSLKSDKEKASLYVTGISQEDEKKQYDQVCLQYGITFKGQF